MSHFGDLVRELRKEKGLTLEAMARKIGSHKGYVSGIENDKVKPPSEKYIRKFAKVFGQDPRPLVRLAWVDRAPLILREDAERFLEWVRWERPALKMNVPSEMSPVPSSPTPDPANPESLSLWTWSVRLEKSTSSRRGDLRC